MNTSASVKIVTKFWSKKIITQIKNILVMPSFQTLHINRHAKIIFYKKDCILSEICYDINFYKNVSFRFGTLEVFSIKKGISTVDKLKISDSNIYSRQNENI